mmetsp:Transcript_14524/g.30133  ORF Transcript_14524/g.30133 Transcript_14524/m.30133 type:complete len:207 (-) Transcript_14524:98-718(-)
MPYRQFLYPRESLLFHFFGNHKIVGFAVVGIVAASIRPRCRFGVRPRRVRKRIEIVKLDGFHQVQCPLEGFFGFTRKSNNDVGRNGRIRGRGTDLVDDFHVALKGVATPHPAQDVVVTGLEWHVKAFTDRVERRHRIDDMVREISRVGRYVSQPCSSATTGTTRRKQIGVQIVQEIRKRSFGDHVTPVRIDVLSQKRDFSVSTVLY